MYRILMLTLLVSTQPASGASLLVDDLFNDYAATGLAPGGKDGALDSDVWVALGAGDGDTAFGVSRAGGDYGRGVSGGGVGAGGLYAFLLPGGQTGLGVQATGSDFSPGGLVRRARNEADAAVTDLTLSMDLWYLNNGARSTRMSLDVATPLAPEWTPVPALGLDTPAASDGLGWQAWPLVAALPVAALDTGATLLLRWSFDDLGGSGSRDEIALSGLRLAATALAEVPVTAVAPPVATLFVLGLGLLAASRRRAAPAVARVGKRN